MNGEIRGRAMLGSGRNRFYVDERVEVLRRLFAHGLHLRSWEKGGCGEDGILRIANGGDDTLVTGLCTGLCTELI